VRVIVSDTGPLLHLQEAKLLGLLGLAGQVHVPLAVAHELTGLRPDWGTVPHAWLKVHTLSEPAKSEAEAWVRAGLLDRGEGDAIALARLLKPDWLLTDDAAARLFAQAIGLDVHGSLGIVLWAAATHHLGRPEAEAALGQLAGTSLWISAAVMAEAKAALEQIFA
jgi:predicted nucleic acid-binding protein